MRVYLPATMPLLRAAVERGELGPPPLVAFAVTASLREGYADGDAEELEYAAFIEAGRASLRLLSEDPVASRRRVVLAAEVPDAAVSVAAEPAVSRSDVRVRVAVPLSRVVSAHLDDPTASAVVAAAANVVLAADLGNDDAMFVVDEAEGHELGWYAAQEIPTLVESG